MKKVKLTRGKFALVDNKDFYRVSSLRWYAVLHRGYRWEVMANSGGGRKKTKSVRLHRFILDAKPGTIVDHINGDTLDNRRQNLRFCSHDQNLSNRGKSRNNTSGFKGVSWDNVSKKWVAQISKFYKHYNLGRFDNKIDAAIAYNKKAVELNGDFACLNKL